MAKKPGRPRKSVKRPVLQFRVREPIYKALKKTASQHGRSASAEAEAILETALLPASLPQETKEQALRGFDAIVRDIQAGKPPSW